MIAGNSSDGVEVHGLCLDWLNVKVDPAEENISLYIHSKKLMLML